MQIVSPLLLFLFLCLFAGASRATSPEDTYLAARDKYIAQFKAMERAKANSEKIDAAHTKALADLEGKLRGLLGEVSVKGFSGGGKINLESLIDSEVGYGMLDGMVYSDGGDDGPQLVVTTRYLLDKWLATAGKRDRPNRIPADLGSALALDQFYTFSVGSDAAFTRDANLEIAAPPGVELARAVLGGWAQDIGPNPDHSLIVTVVRDGKVSIASMRPNSAVGEIAACQAIWTEGHQKAEKLRAAHEALARSKKVVDTSDDKTEEKADRDFHACLVQRAPEEAFYPSLVQEAQQFVDRIAGK